MDELRIPEAIGASLKHELDKLAKAGRILELNGHGDRIFGHVALRGPEGRGFWLKRHHGDEPKRVGGGSNAQWDYFCRVLARAEAQGDPRLSDRCLL